ncbi:MAG: hypothetical protein HYV07_06030 [Deltaproteobacteria bacterium]|nr:hypothetical protein [Deltaproteobacteria bacterium]
MAKKPKAAEEAPSRVEEGLPREVVQRFERGDFIAARADLRRELEAGKLAGAGKELAERLLEATRIDRAPILVGLGCVGLIALVILVTLATQP